MPRRDGAPLLQGELAYARALDVGRQPAQEREQDEDDPPDDVGSLAARLNHRVLAAPDRTSRPVLAKATPLIRGPNAGHSIDAGAAPAPPARQTTCW